VHAYVNVAILMYVDSLVTISDGYRNQKAVQNQLYVEVLTQARALEKTVSCRGFLRK